jgi:predicted small integral membrane protein
MLITRLGKTALVAAMAFYASLVAFGNMTDYGTNYAFVEHVLKMDTIFPGATITYRAIDTPWMWDAFYVMIIAAETLTAVLCWIGAFVMLRRLRDGAQVFNRAKAWAIGGLSFGFLVWQVAFQSVGGEWFGMWQSQTWNGEDSAFRIFITMIAVLIFVTLKDDELPSRAGGTSEHVR